MLDLSTIVGPSVGSMVVVGLALLMAVFLVWFYWLIPKEKWVLWGALNSLGASLYAFSIFVNYNSTGEINRISEQLQYTGILLIIHAMAGLTLSYFSKNNRLYQMVFGAVNLALMAITWFSDFIVSREFVARQFDWIDRPYVKPVLGPLGFWFLAYCIGTALYLLIIWVKNRSQRPLASRYFIAGFIFWLVLGLHDTLVTLGMSSKLFIMEYGFLGFCMGILGFTMVSYREMVWSLSRLGKMEAMGTLASGVAHDFNNTLQAIGGYLGELRRGQHLDQEGLKTIDKTEEVIQRGADLVRSLLFLGRGVGSEFKLVDINDEVKRAVDILSRTMPRMIIIKTDLAPGLRGTYGDPSQLGQAILNLCTNARDAMPQGGVLSIQTALREVVDGRSKSEGRIPPGIYVRLSVSDTGSGMAHEVRQRAFEPFFSTKDPSQGTGLGLAAVKHIVQLHGGHIALETKQRLGTTFHLYLPAAPVAELPVADQAEQSREAQAEPATLLLVDDERPILETTAEGLKCLGYQVLAAQSGEEALQLFSHGEAGIDLVVLDLNMPGMGGERCLDELRRLKPEVKVLLASGYLLDPDVHRELLAKADGRIAKPYTLNDLNHKIRTLVAA